MRRYIYSTLFFMIASGSSHAINHPAEVVIRVLEEDGSVVSNAHVLVSFELDNRGGRSSVRETVTDALGLCTLKERTSGYIYVRIRKDGYYESQLRLKWHQQQTRTETFPLSGTTNDVVLRATIDPIPLFARSVYSQIPQPGQEFGYDFEVGDWVPPLGNGNTPDAYFRVDGYWNGYRDNEAVLTVRFPNPKDGLQFFEKPFQESAFHSPYNAPLDGYIRESKWRRSRVPNPDATGHSDSEVVTIDRNGNANYFLRIRTKQHETGQIESALYGKIYGDIEFGGASENGGYLKIKAYYLNPTPNDRNLEFDSNRNLFTDLPLSTSGPLSMKRKRTQPEP